MTSDTPTDAQPVEQGRKPARRRATRPAAAPKGPQAEQAASPAAATEAAPSSTASSALADLVLPERADARAGSTASGASALSAIVLPEGPAGRASDDAADKPARTRRRATRSTGAQRAAEPAAAEPTAAEPTAEAAPKGRTRTRRATAPKAEAPAAPDTTADTVEGDAQADVAETAPAAEAPAKKTTTRKSAGAGKATEKTAARTTQKTTEKSAEKPAKKTAKPATETPVEQAAAPAEQPAEAAAEKSAPRSPAATGGGSVTPRLATTAVLFQAPDLSTARRSRRAQAPAGPPRPHDAPAESAPAESASVEPEAASSAPEPAPAAESSTVEAPRTRSRRATRGTRAAKAAEPAEQVAPTADAAPVGSATESPAESPVEPQAPAEPVTDVELSEDEAAAVEEVGAIESELVAEGVELVDLGPEDLSDEDGEDDEIRPRRRRRRGGRGRRGGRRPEGEAGSDADLDEGGSESDREDEGVADGDAGAPGEDQADEHADDRADEDTDEQGEDDGGESASSRRRRRRRRGTRQERAEAAVARTRDRDEVTALKGSTRLEAKRQRRREGRDAGRRRQIITEAEFLARRESVTRSMVVRERDGRTQIAVLEDGVLVEHYVSQQSQASMVGNVYLGRVQNVLPSMEAAFVDVGKGRNAVLYAGEVNWDAAGLEGQPRRIEEALKSGDSVLVQVTKDPIGHKGARLTSQVTLAGRYLVFVPGGGMTGISRKLPDTERSRLKKILRDVVPEGAGVIVRTAAEGASEAELRADVERLESQWAAIQKKAKSASAPALLQGEPDLAIRVVRDIFNDDFSSLQIQGQGAWDEIAQYVEELAPDLRDRVTKWTENTDVFAVHRVDEQLAKGMDRKVWLPSGGSLVIDRTEAMTVIDVNTGKFTGAGGTLEETVTRNNLEAAEEIVRQLRLRDIGGIVVIDFIDMVLESNRDLVLRRLVECLGRDRTKHQVAEVTSLGLVQMTRKRVGQGLVEAFSETCEHCKGRGFIVHSEPIEKGGAHQHHDGDQGEASKRSRRKRGGKQAESASPAAAAEVPTLPEDRSEAREAVKATLATIAAAAAHAHEHEHDAPGAKDTATDTTTDSAKDSAKGAEKDSAPAQKAPAAEVPAADVPAPLELPEPVEPTAVTPVAPETLIELPERKPEPEAAPEPAAKPAKKAPRRARKGAGAPKPAQSGAGEAAAAGVTGTE
ncbi:Rne/Rng family ribonuclease [Isoptericola sp. NPDC019693]|uniref:Rne/Rng family ribonuclease n=1 Tax=Isoptericola sp. NPDC019693 TaxID=3364009 RepID=UPI00379FCBCA